MKKLQYFIHQLPLTNERKFRSLKPSEHINLCDYCCVWQSSKFDSEMTDEELCEYIFHRFNLNLPEHYAGTSLSVSDVIGIVDLDSEQMSFYHCNDLGFAKIVCAEGCDCSDMYCIV